SFLCERGVPGRELRASRRELVHFRMRPDGVYDDGTAHTDRGKKAGGALRRRISTLCGAYRSLLPAIVAPPHNLLAQFARLTSRKSLPTLIHCLFLPPLRILRR